MKTQILGRALMSTLFVVLTSGYPASGQNRERDKIELRTRLVLLDVLVTEKRTGAAIDDLVRANFEVRDDRKARTLTYFSAKEKRRPLALILVLDLAPNGAGRFFRQPDILRSLGAAFSRLLPGDEVAIIATWVRGAAANEQYLTRFTSDRAKIEEALMKVPELVAPYAILAFPYVSVAELLSEAAQLAKSKPNSNVLLVYVSDSLVVTDSRERQRGTESAHRGNVTFSALLCSTKKTVLARSVPFVPLFLALGISTNAADYFADQTGGQAIRVHKPEDYRKGLEDIIGGLSSRYNVGFELDADEPDDGRLHRLDVKVKAADKSGKPRKLEVVARRGYFLPKPQQPVAQKTGQTEAPPVTIDQAKRQTDEQAIKQSVYELRYSVMTGDIEGVKRLTAKRTLDLTRLFFDLLFKKTSNRGGSQDIPASSGDELFKLMLGLLAESSKGNVSAEQIRDKARAKSECRITFTGDQTARVEYSGGISSKAVFEDGRWKIDDTERLKGEVLKIDELTPEEKDRIRKY